MTNKRPVFSSVALIAASLFFSTLSREGCLSIAAAQRPDYNALFAAAKPTELWGERSFDSAVLTKKSGSNTMTTVIPSTLPFDAGTLTPNVAGISTSAKNGTVTTTAITNGSKYDVNKREPWRAEAEARIENFRKGELTVTVLDAAGKPVSGAEVKVNMKRHEFGFGGAVSEPTTNTDVRKQQYLDLFNAAVFENSMKIKQDARMAESGQSTSMLKWLTDNGIPARAHCLVWGAWANLPDGYKALYDKDPAGLKQMWVDRINKWVPFWGDRVTEWDVVNEGFRQNACHKLIAAHEGIADFTDTLHQWFNQVRSLNPKMKLYYCPGKKFAKLIKPNCHLLRIGIHEQQT